MAFSVAIYAEAKRPGLAVRVLWECIAVTPPLCMAREAIDEIVEFWADFVSAVSS